MKKIICYQVRYIWDKPYDRATINLPDPLGYVYLEKENAKKRLTELSTGNKDNYDIRYYIDTITMYFQDNKKE